MFFLSVSFVCFAQHRYGKLTRPKDFPKVAAGDAAQLAALHAHLAEMATATRRCNSPQLLALLKDGMAMLLRSLLHPGSSSSSSSSSGGAAVADESRVAHACTLLRELLALFVERKSKTLNVVFFVQLLGARFPAIGWRLLPDVLAAVVKARTLFLSLELLVIAQEIMRQPSHAAPTAALVADVLRANAAAVVGGALHVLKHAELQQRVKAKRLRETVLRVLADFARLSSRHSTIAAVFGASGSGALVTVAAAKAATPSKKQSAAQAAAATAATANGAAAATALSVCDALESLQAVAAYAPTLKSAVPALVAQLRTPLLSSAGASSSSSTVAPAKAAKRKTDETAAAAAPEPEASKPKPVAGGNKKQAAAAASAAPVAQAPAAEAPAKKKAKKASA